MLAKKRFGQNWLNDELTLDRIVESADISKEDIVLEVGPGLGYLTKKLVEKAKKVMAVELDRDLIPKLNKLSDEYSNLEIIQSDILEYNLGEVEKNYKVVANIPYYLTSKLIRKLLEAKNSPDLMVIMVQKEVAERIVAKPGKMSLLSFSVQYYARTEIIMNVSRELFEPAPNVDSSVLKIARLPKTIFEAETSKLFRLVKAGFGEKRKMLRNSLAGGLNISNSTVEELLESSQIKPTARAQELSMLDWQKLYNNAIRCGLI